MKHSDKITFRVTKELKDELKYYAKLKGISTGKLIRNWMTTFVSNQAVNAPRHFYQTQSGKQFPNMKAACDDLKLSSHAFRSLVKNEVIQKINIEQNQAKEHGDELQNSRNRIPKRDRI